MVTRARLAACLALAACGGGGRPDAGADELAGRKAEVLGELGAAIFLPVYRRFADAAAALETAAASHAAGGDPTEVRAAWIEAMAAWQQAELFVFGPAGPPPGVTTDFAGEMMLRDEIYSYPLSNTCRVDQEIVEGAFVDPDAFAAELVNVRGLDAMEYLLFVESAENTCSALSPINADGSWAALGEPEVRRRRAVYAHTLAILVHRAALRLRDAWEPDSGDFVGALRASHGGASPFASSHQALTELGAAMLYIDTHTQGLKVGEPAGIEMCAAGTCAEQLESRFARTSRENVIANVQSFRLVFRGGDGLGLDDLLIELGSAELAARIVAAIDEALAALEALGPLEDAIASDPAAVMTAYTELAEAARLFKIDAFAVLNVDPSAYVPRDTD